jgi:hypothetical protein
MAEGIFRHMELKFLTVPAFLAEVMSEGMLGLFRHI